MNHCQFLCYGMMKIFLKEVINADDNDPCLSSYFIKTDMFWVVHNDRRIEWTPCNLFFCLWNCLKLLLSWVYRGECPNFFIPQNNMFKEKVVGHKQAALFEKLYLLYNKGISCLLLSPTIANYLIKSTLDRTLTPSTEECEISSDFHLDLCLFHEINRLLQLSVHKVCIYCFRTISKKAINFVSENNSAIAPLKIVYKLLFYADTTQSNIK